MDFKKLDEKVECWRVGLVLRVAAQWGVTASYT